MDWKAKMKHFFGECKITLRLLKKPTKDELKVILQVTALGSLIIGSIGFAIRILFYYLFNQ
ncbi:MAG: protein translocase SEC61 complex subunit gamma [Nitrospiraceae bacterium]|nr:protein translocase SEC61 complex subunit gamma [Nitrospiraceae bacterium]